MIRKLSINLIRLCSHDEIVFVQTANLMRPPIDVLMNSIPNILVWSRTVKIQIAGNPKNLLYRPSVNLLVDENHTARLLFLAG